MEAVMLETKQNALDPARGRRRNPADVLRHERARPANLAQHLAALDRIDPHRRPVDARRCRLEPGHSDGDGPDREERDRGIDGSANLLFPDDAGGTSYINH